MEEKKYKLFHKREYNSERRRKLILNVLYLHNHYSIIRENITPRGDGNFIEYTVASVLLLFKIRENITPRGDGNST